ncbi:MAG: hypothetical protein JXB24_03215 [Bacteroidales bacterium]|nr:hypothetical protein [Bacteroidales bacterium]
MKKVFLILLIILSSMMVYSKDNPENKTKGTDTKVIINHTMIENFNAVEYDEQTITFFDLIGTCSLDEVKLIYHAYQHGDSRICNQEVLNEKLTELQSMTENPAQEVKKMQFYTVK